MALGVASPGCLEDVVGRIEETLRLGRLPCSCCACGVSATSICNVEVRNDDVALTLPVRVCARCVRKPPFVTKETSPRLWLFSLALLLAAISFAVEQPRFAIPAVGAALLLLGWIIWQVRLRGRRPTAPMGEILGKVAEYRDLMKAASAAVFVPRPETCVAASRSDLLASGFVASVQLHRMRAFLGSETELARSLMPASVGHAIVEIVDREVVRFFREHVADREQAVQVVCAILPGRRNAFEVQGPPSELTASLLAHLSSLPSWPVAYPFVFLVTRRFGGAAARARPRSRIEQPLISWLRSVAIEGPLTYAELACRFHQIELGDEAIETTVEDVERLRARLPDSVELALAHAELLTATGRHEESLAIHDSLIASHSGEKHYRHLRVSCLESADQLERAAAECKAMLTDLPDDADTRGYLAHLLLKMGRPEDAIRTASEAIACEEQPRLYLVRAQAQMAIEKYQGAMADLNLALSREANTAGAYLLRSRVHLHERHYEEAVADLDKYHRIAGQTIESLYLKGIALRGQGVPGEAARMFDDAINGGLDHPLLKVQRAECLAESGKLELALQDCDRVLEEFPEAAAAYVVRAAVHLESGRHAQAIEDGERAVEFGAEVPRAYMVLGLARAAVGDPQQGDEDLTRALHLDPGNPSVLLHRAHLRTMLGNDDGAIEDLSAVIQSHPQWAEAFAQRGFLRLKASRFDEALADFEAAIRVAPQMADAYRGRAGVLATRGNRSEAMIDLDKAVAIDPQNVACRLARANLLLWDDDRQGAKADLDAALQATPDLLPALLQRAHVHLSLGEHEAARRDFDAVVKQTPEAADSFIARSVAWELVGNLEQSEKDIDEATRAAPQDAERLEVLRLVLCASTAHYGEQYDKAVDYATRVIEHDPDNVQAFQIRAGAYWYSERFVEAIDDYSHLIAASEEPHGSYHNGRGQVYAELGEFEKAIEDLNRAVELTRQNGSAATLAYALNGRGRALTGLGRSEEAERDFAESLRLKPDNAWLHFNRGLLYLETAQPDKAAVCFDLSLNVSSPRLTPRKRARAGGFLAKIARDREPA